MWRGKEAVMAAKGEDFASSMRDRDEINITVVGRRTGKQRTLPVWFVVEGNKLYLLPVRGSKTQWFRNLQVNKAMTIKAGRQSVTVEAQSLLDSQKVALVAGKFRKKYTAEEIAKYYTGLDACVLINLPAGASTTKN